MAVCAYDVTLADFRKERGRAGAVDQLGNLGGLVPAVVEVITWVGKVWPQSAHGCDFSSATMARWRAIRRRRRLRTRLLCRRRLSGSAYQSREAAFWQVRQYDWSMVWAASRYPKAERGRCNRQRAQRFDGSIRPLSETCATETPSPVPRPLTNLRAARGCSSMVELQPSKLAMRVRFPSPALVPIGDPAPVAQWTEQEPSKLLAEGSNPSGGARRSHRPATSSPGVIIAAGDVIARGYHLRTHGGRSSAWLERLVVVQEAAGSNPVGHPNSGAVFP